jgi:hypothetical protein
MLLNTVCSTPQDSDRATATELPTIPKDQAQQRAPLVGGGSVSSGDLIHEQDWRGQP